MRLFFGVKISRDLGDIIWEEIKKSPVYDSPWRWIQPRNYHLTLKFLGETDRRLLGGIKETTERLLSETGSPFKIAFDLFGAFPSLSRPKVIFYSIREGKDELAGLANGFDREMEPLGFRSESRPYQAHLTLARIRRRLPPGLIENLKRVPSLPEEANQLVDSVTLFRSRLKKTGAIYEKVYDFSL